MREPECSRGGRRGEARSRGHPRGSALRRGGAWVCAAAALASAACVHVSLGQALARREWSEVRVGSLRLISELGPDRTREFAARMELFAGVLRRLTGAEPRAQGLPTTVLLVSPRLYVPIAAQMGQAGTYGFFAPTLRGNFAVVGDFHGLGEKILFHEYVHYALSSDPNTSYPAWYHEGLAELLSELEVDSDVVRVGLPIESWLRVLRGFGAMRSRSLFGMTRTGELDELDRARFYAQSWLTVLYLTHGAPVAARAGLPDRTGQLQTYVSLCNRGLSPAEAFSEAFGVSFERFDRELARFLQEGSTVIRRFPRERLDVPEIPPAQTIHAADALEAFAGLCASDPSQALCAERLYAQGLELAPARPSLLFGWGRARWQQGLLAGVGKTYERARALAPDADLTRLEYGLFLTARAAAEEGETSERLGREALELLEAVAQGDRALPAAYWALATALEWSGAPRARVIEAHERAYRRLPSHPELAYRLAQALSQDGRSAEARRIATRALAGVHDATSAARFEALLSPGEDPETPASETRDDWEPALSPD